MAPIIIESRDFWKEFLRMYRDLPELWKIKSDAYKNRDLKTAGYAILVQKLQQIDKTADRNTVKRKINAFRTSYRRELSKVILYSKKPSLWYFDDLEFLRDEMHEIPIHSLMNDEKIEFEEIKIESDHNSTNSPPSFCNNPKVELGPQSPSEGIKMIQNIMDYPSTTQNEPSSTCNTNFKRKFPANEDQMDVKRSLPSEAAHEDQKMESEAEVIAKFWAMEYVKLSPDQKMFAKKAINDILFEAQMGTLNRNSVIINPSRDSYTDPSNY